MRCRRGVLSHSDIAESLSFGDRHYKSKDTKKWGVKVRNHFGFSKISTLLWRWSEGLGIMYDAFWGKSGL